MNNNVSIKNILELKITINHAELNGILLIIGNCIIIDKIPFKTLNNNCKNVF